MTCEIAIMNRYAIALAADSAVTVTYQSGRERKERYFKGANKIFQLSTHHPVGIMVFGTATLHEVPWELIVKEYRRHLGTKSFSDLESYAMDLFEYIRGHDRLFPADYQEKVFRDEAVKVGFVYLMAAQENEAISKAEDKTAAYAKFLAERIADVTAMPLYDGFSEEDLNAALAKHQAAVESGLKEYVGVFDVEQHVDRAKLAEAAIRALINNPTHLMESTGVVIAGFADLDYFPRFVEFSCYGIVLGKFVRKADEAQGITREAPAHIKAFAMTDMVNTFQLGVSPDVYRAAYAEWRKSLRALADALTQGPAGAGQVNVDDVIKKVVDEHTKAWFQAAWKAHTTPLLRVVASFSIDEMAELAETLIELESVKERVTKPTESVGGPIDVAVISKSDGFVWIKRKHYFDPKLNPRFFQRQEGS